MPGALFFPLAPLVSLYVFDEYSGVDRHSRLLGPPPIFCSNSSTVFDFSFPLIVIRGLATPSFKIGSGPKKKPPLEFFKLLNSTILLRPMSLRTLYTHVDIEPTDYPAYSVQCRAKSQDKCALLDWADCLLVLPSLHIWI